MGKLISSVTMRYRISVRYRIGAVLYTNYSVDTLAD